MHTHTTYLTHKINCTTVFLSFLILARIILDSSVLFPTFDQSLCYVNPTLEISHKSNSFTSFPTSYHYIEFFLQELLQILPIDPCLQFSSVQSLIYSVARIFILKKSHNVVFLLKDLTVSSFANGVKFNLVHMVHMVHNLDPTYLSNLITCHSSQPHTLHNYQTELSCFLNTQCFLHSVCINFFLGLESPLYFSQRVPSHL